MVMTCMNGSGWEDGIELEDGRKWTWRVDAYILKGT